MGVLSDFRSKGWKPALQDIGADVFTRVTSGIPPQEFRNMLRGEPPGRPNPRLKPHSEGFLLHIKPTYYHESVTKFTHTFRLGLLSTYLFFFELVTGIFLMIFYAPTPERAYGDMLDIMSNVPFGQLMRDLHRLGAEAMVVIVTLHMFRTFLTGSYKAPRQFTWFTGVALLLCTLFLSFSGYLLPWDQLAFWAVTIGTSMAEATPPPVVGEHVNLLLRGGPEIGEGGLLRFYLLHVLFVPALLLLFFFVHYYKVVHFGISLPSSEEEIGEDTANRVPANRRRYYLVDVLVDESWLIVVLTFLLVAGSIWWYSAPLENPADPQVTPLHTVAPWYFLWIQGLLKIGDVVIMGIVVPTVVFGFLFVLPYLDWNPSRRARDRKVAIVGSLVFSVILVVTTWMGTAAYGVEAPAPVEVIQEFIPEEGVGPVRELYWDELHIGDYDTREATNPAHGATEFDHLLRDIQRRIDRDPGLQDGYAVLSIELWQPRLKRLTMHVHWIEEGEERTFNKKFFFHEHAIYH